ncbi:MAG: tRNA (adenosine(37)-N6)-threonylcarbamoyltransferase complex transferase subunit TsaD [Mycoplasmoidaceae bacterium]|nr:tRNA (adenosine(37)-N6)-threonylcarbamoyltransferase complex transferase subunit TsaD [Mycoplasmoidaceae bacterium]
MKKTCILAIETSCDDTSLALVKNNKLISESTSTSLKEHTKFGGIVPEIAARSHEQNISLCLLKLFQNTKIDYQDLTHIAYTDQPGLPGSLHIGKVFAKSLAHLTNSKLVPVNHMNGHIFSFSINRKIIKYPFLSLVASGGHTSIYLVKSYKDIKLLNTTKDDAVGETLDKIGRSINLPYPGGISIDKVYDKNKTRLKMINHFPPVQQFSFSGLKTHVLNYVNSQKMKKKKIDKILVASSSLE